MAVSLPDDLLLEILYRVKDAPAVLFRCATACKRWRQLVLEPAFLGRCWPDQDASSFFVGLFSQEREGAGMTRSRTKTPCFTPTPRSVLCPSRRSLSSFITAAPAGLFNQAVPLASRHGLLLVRLDTIATRCYTSPFILELAVCNLLTGACHILPVLMFGSSFDECEWSCYSILTGKDCHSGTGEEPSLVSDSSLFKVVIISSDKLDDMCTLHIFSSDETSWTVRTHDLDGLMEPINYGSAGRRAIVNHGTAHWLFCHYGDGDGDGNGNGDVCLVILNLNMCTYHITWTKLPLAMNWYLKGDPFISLSVSGALSLIYMQKKGTQIKIWEQQDGRSKWVCTRTVKLRQHGKSEQNEDMKLFVLGEKCGILLVSHTLHGAYAADLQTGIMEELDNWPGRGYIASMEAVPMEMDWPAIFACRLDTRKQKMENNMTYPPGWEHMFLQGTERQKNKNIDLGGK